MPITFYCPNPGCRAKLTVPDSVAGKRGKCTKCKELMTVPAESAAEPPAGPATKGTSAKATPPPPRAARPVAPPPVPAPPPEWPPVDADAAAADVFSDGPHDAETTAEFIEFTCPQCDEPVKMPLDMGGKRAPCPSCRRIIAVPMPKKTQKTSWRDTGPNLPAGAKREEQDAPEGAWEGKAGAVGTEALKEAGVIQERRKPLTLLEKTGPTLVVVMPVLLLIFGGLFLWQYLNSASEKKALDTALASAKSDAGQMALGADGLIAVHGFAGKYYLRSQVAGGSKTPGAATLAREQYGKAVAVAGSWHTPAGDALLGELALAQLDLGGNAEEIDADRKLKWTETQKLVRSTLATIRSQPGKVAALRRVVEGLVAHGQTNVVLPMTFALYPTEGADRSEAIAVVGLELLRLGKKDEAVQAYAKAVAPYADKKTRPELRASVVALAVALERKPPKVADKEAVEDGQQRGIGTAEGLARLGKLAEARQEKVAREDGGRLHALVALADGAYSTKQGDSADLDAALAAVGDGAGRAELNWVYLRLVELATTANIAPAQIEPAVAAIEDKDLRDWARLVMYRKRLEASKVIETEDGLGVLTPKRLGGRVALLEMAWHNTRRDSSWGKVVNTWDEAPKATGSLGVALGMQGGR
jgi:hypothetical protein